VSAQEILAREEIDALIHGMEHGAIATERPPDPREARSHDFSHNVRIVRGRMPTLEMINERFGLYRGRAADARAPVQIAPPLFHQNPETV